MNFVSQWIKVSFLNLFLVSLLGFVLRYKIVFSLPFVDQKNLLHSHSHFAFTGWVTQTLMLLLVYYLSVRLGEQVFTRYRFILYANLLSSYGMLVSFILQGYAFYSISFSTLSIIAFCFFWIFFWNDLNRIREKTVSQLWFRWALIFGAISNLGPFALAFLMSVKMADQNWYLSSVYFYLHFQYNGWFLFAGLGLLTDQLTRLNIPLKKLYYAFYLFSATCIPAYFLSVLWLPFVGNIYYFLIAAVLAQLVGWYFILKTVFENSEILGKQYSMMAKVLFILSAIAFTIKLLLQTGSIHPQLSQLSYGFRPIIIGYLHLVLLGVTTIFIIGYIVSLKMISVSRKVVVGAMIFIAGVIINELLLMIQGVAAMAYRVVPYIQIMLFGAAIILMIGLGTLFIGSLKSKQAPK